MGIRTLYLVIHLWLNKGELNMTGNFSLDNLIISNPRSLKKDTDYVTITVTVGNAEPISKTQALGDLGDGTHNVSLALQVDIPDTPTPIVFAYAVVNNGHANEALVQKGTEAALAYLTKTGAKLIAQQIGQPIGDAVGAALGASIGTAIVPLVGTAIGAIAGFVTSYVGGIIFADCDGTVATGVRAYVSGDLLNQTANGKTIKDDVNHPGTDSPTGCGANSKYVTNTTISSFAAIKPAFDINGHYAAGGHAGPIITTAGNTIAIDMSAYKRPNATGVLINPTTAHLVFTDDKTQPGGAYTVTIEPPATLYFQGNKSTWVKTASITTPVSIKFPVIHVTPRSGAGGPVVP